MTMKKREGINPLIIFSFNILLCLSVLGFLVWGKSILEIIKEGITDDERVLEIKLNDESPSLQ